MNGKNSNKLSIYLLVTLLFSTFFGFISNPIPRNDDDIYSISQVDENVKKSAPYQRIFIHLDNWSGFAGSGSAEDPYLIKDYDINGLNQYDCILIQNSTKHFRIENCTLFNIGSLNSNSAGIKILNASNGVIVNNTCTTNNAGNYGMFLKHCNNTQIINNTVSYLEIGIILEYNCNYTLLEGNVANYNTDNGIYIRGHSTYGICYFNTVSRNTANYNDNSGIFIYYFYNGTINENVANSNNNTDSSTAGLKLWGCTYSEIVGNRAENNKYGAYLSSFNFNFTSNVIFNSTLMGISCSACRYFNFSNNIITNSSTDGIRLSGNSHNGTFTDNIVSNNDNNGIDMFSTDDCTFTRNQLSNNAWFGVRLWPVPSECVNNKFYGNYLYDNIMDNSADSGTNTIWNSTTLGNYWGDYTGSDSDKNGIGDSPYTNVGGSGKYDWSPIYGDPRFNGSAIHIDDYYGTARTWAYASTRDWCSGNGTYSDPYVIEDLVINGKNATSCITIEDSNTKYFKIKNCSLYNSSVLPDGGISLTNVSKGIITDNNCSFNEGCGIYEYEGYNNTFSNNIVFNNSLRGIYIDGTSGTFNENITIIGNNIQNNTGIGLGMEFMKTSVVSNNYIRKNTGRGINLVSDSDYVNVTRNCIVYNGQDGIYVGQASGCDYNKFWLNYLIGNEWENADGGAGNPGEEWDNGSIGNYWDDYGGADGNDDGIGDTAHIIPGTGSTLQDDFPIWDDGHNGSKIHIDDSGNWGNGTWTWAETKTWCTGSGTSQDPYILDGIKTNCGNSGSGIIIGNSTKYFLIKNSSLSNSGASVNDSGIYLNNVQNGVIITTNLTSNQGYGLFVDGLSSDITIYSNNFTGNAIHARDDGSNVGWDNGTIGNWWDNYTGYDCNGDDIGETRYNVSGIANSQDRFPIWFYDDIFAPNITIEKPTPLQLFDATAPEFNITIDEYILNTTWYTIDAGATNFTITQLNGTINQTAWTGSANGTIMIIFYANDSAGNIGSKNVTIHLDKIAPIINVIKPTANEKSGTNPPAYEITVTEAHLHKMWYTIDGAGYYNFTSLTGIINTQAWDSLPDRSITITFYANDTLGNQAFVTFIVVKDRSTLGLDPLILLIIIGIIGAVSVGALVAVRGSKKKLRVKESELAALTKQRDETTEDDIVISKEKRICLVHKGPIEGYNYVCPSCGANYCVRCVEVLKKNENECWSCQSPLDSSKPSKSQKDKQDKGKKKPEDIIVEQAPLKEDIHKKLVKTEVAPKKAPAPKGKVTPKPAPKLKIRTPTPPKPEPTTKKALLPSPPKEEPVSSPTKTPSETKPIIDMNKILGQTIAKKEAQLKKFNDYLVNASSTVEKLDEQFSASSISQDEYIKKKTYLMTRIGEATSRIDKLKDELKMLK